MAIRGRTIRKLTKKVLRKGREVIVTYEIIINAKLNSIELFSTFSNNKL